MFKIILRKKFGGCKNFFWKICDRIFFSFENWSKKVLNPIFSKKIIHNSTFWQKIWIQNNFSFHLIWILSILIENYNSLKIDMQKTGKFWHYLTGKIWFIKPCLIRVKMRYFFSLLLALFSFYHLIWPIQSCHVSFTLSPLYYYWL